jgi:3-deoxy-7-phosphoheptulonate synthase
MIIVLKTGLSDSRVSNLISDIKSMGLEINISEGKQHTILGLIGDTSKISVDDIEGIDVVESVKRISEPYKQVNRKMHPQDSMIPVGGGLTVGEGHFHVIAGPCSVESEEQIIEVAKAVKASGATMLRGGAFKPRTSPYAFQGLHADGLKLLLMAKKATGLPIVTEIMTLITLICLMMLTLFRLVQGTCRILIFSRSLEMQQAYFAEKVLPILLRIGLCPQSTLWQEGITTLSFVKEASEPLKQ